MSNALFVTKDLIVTSALIEKCRDVAVVEYFVDMKSGKGLITTESLAEAKKFAIAYQALLD